MGERGREGREAVKGVLAECQRGQLLLISRGALEGHAQGCVSNNSICCGWRTTSKGTSSSC